MLYRRNTQMNDDSDEDGPMPQQALPVDTNLEIDETRPASSAAEYLLRVRLERQQLPKVVHKDIRLDQKRKSNPGKLSKRKKSKHFTDYNHFFAETTSDCQNEKAFLLPNEKWKRKFVNAFTVKRNLLMQHIVESQTDSKRHKREYASYLNVDVPHCQQTEEWLKFALNYHGKSGQNECKDNRDGQYPVPPYLAIIQRLTPMETEKLLQLFMRFVINTHDGASGDSYGLNGISALWLYSLFLRLELPLRAEITANIRDFARFCIAHRNKLQEDETSSLIAFANIFIVIIEEVLKQPIT